MKLRMALTGMLAVVGILGVGHAQANLILTAVPGGGNGGTDNVIFNACNLPQGPALTMARPGLAVTVHPARGTGAAGGGAVKSLKTT